VKSETVIGDIHGKIYQKLLQVIPDILTIEESGKSVVDGFMDLNLDILQRKPDRIIIALSHYYKQNGDMIADPDMEVAVYPQRQTAEALAYQDCYSYRRVYGEDNATIDISAERDLNQFLSQWLTNLIQQGHRITPESDDCQGHGESK
jgi:uncharacterized protein YqiB (DUF1249 family)